jgi:L-threonylcarbamoyladenylate synthase
MAKNTDSLRFFWDKQADLEKIIHLLKKNKVLITTTDTIPGFLASTSRQTFETIASLKGDRGGKPFLILASSAQRLTYFTDESLLDDGKRALLDACWPGPLTVIFKARESLPLCIAPQGTVAIRIPQHKGLLAVLSHFNGLFSTSANRSGIPAPTALALVEPELAQAVAALVDSEEDSPHAHQIPSTILDFSKPNVVRLVRAGAYSKEELEDIYGSGIES